MTAEESDGPDLCVHNKHCCDPCTHIRPGIHNREATSGLEAEVTIRYRHCCKCVPRVIMANFTPNVGGGDCCRTFSMPMFYGGSTQDSTGVYSSYSGSFFGYTMSIKLGRFVDEYGFNPGVDTLDGCVNSYCAWKFRVYDDGYFDEEDEVLLTADGDDTCLSVPDVSFGPVTFAGCVGEISFSDLTKGRLPFVEREHVTSFTETGGLPDDYGGFDPPEFIELCPCDCETDELDTLTSVGVQDNELIYEYPVGANENDKPTFVRGDYKIAWRVSDAYGNRWVFVNTNTNVEEAWGGTDGNCPLGVYTRICPEEGRSCLNVSDTDRPFCVSRWDEPHAVCGECEQVCSYVCARGMRHTNGSVIDFAEFEWFEEHEEIANPEDPYELVILLEHGWGYFNSNLNHTERLYLESDETTGACHISTDLEPGAEIFSPVAIDTTRGCSCKMLVPFSATVNHVVVPFTVRCGFCSCWRFFCGTCRCVPGELCVLFYDGSTMHENLILMWDDENQQWGDYDDPIRLRIGGTDECQITTDLELINVDYPTYDCSPESVHKCFDAGNEFLVGTISGDEEQEDGTLRPIYINFMSLTDDCAMVPCGMATPCLEDCGSHPPCLVASLRMWTLPGESSGDPYFEQECIIEVELRFWQTFEYRPTGNVPTYQCGYVGFAVLPVVDEWDCGYIKVELYNGEVFWSWYNPQSTVPSISSMAFVTETCDPYYAQTAEYPGSVFAEWCWGCVAPVEHFQVTVTECPT